MSEPLTERELKDLLDFSPASRRYELIGRCVQELIDVRIMLAKAHMYLLDPHQTDNRSACELELFYYLQKIDPNGELGP